MSTIHSRIKEKRLEKKLSMLALGKLVNVSWQTIQQWERSDGTAPRFSRLQQLADALDTTKAYLLDGEEPSYAPYTSAYASHACIPLALAEPQMQPYFAEQKPSRPNLAKVSRRAELISEDGLQLLLNIMESIAISHPYTQKKCP